MWVFILVILQYKEINEKVGEEIISSPRGSINDYVK